jgi:hypothetical protein
LPNKIEVLSPIPNAEQTSQPTNQQANKTQIFLPCSCPKKRKLSAFYYETWWQASGLFDGPYHMGKFLLILILLRVFIKNKSWILSNAFSAYIITWLYSHILYCGKSHLFLNIDTNLLLQDKHSIRKSLAVVYTNIFMFPSSGALTYALN